MGRRHSLQHDAHTGTLINDHNPIAVTELHHLLGIGIVAGAEGVGTKPAEQVEVLHQQGPVKALPSDLGQQKRAFAFLMCLTLTVRPSEGELGPNNLFRATLN